jgi:hypothetical protein
MFFVMELFILALETVVFVFSISYGMEQGDEILNASSFWNFVRSFIVFLSGFMILYDIGLFVFNLSFPKNKQKVLDQSEPYCGN